MTHIKLVSSEGDEMEVDLDVMKCSQTIKTMLEDLGLQDGDDDKIPLPNVNTATLKKVIEWAIHHKDDLPPDEDDEIDLKRTDNIKRWDAEFANVEEMGQMALYELTLAANYLDIKGLLDLTTKTIANMIKGKTPDEIRKTFNIVNDLTPEEEEQIRKENEWCEEK